MFFQLRTSPIYPAIAKCRNSVNVRGNTQSPQHFAALIDSVSSLSLRQFFEVTIQPRRRDNPRMKVPLPFFGAFLT